MPGTPAARGPARWPRQEPAVGVEVHPLGRGQRGPLAEVEGDDLAAVGEVGDDEAAAAELPAAGCVTARAKAVATAASIALPPLAEHLAARRREACASCETTTWRGTPRRRAGSGRDERQDEHDEGAGRTGATDRGDAHPTVLRGRRVLGMRWVETGGRRANRR